MGHSTSINSFTSELDILDRALASARGIRLPCPSYSAAEHLRHRLHAARRLDRRENRNIYEQGEPMWDKSQYDPLVVRIRTEDDRHYLYVEAAPMPTEIEEL